MARPERPAKKLFPNPFYVLLLVASTLFVVTTLGYLVGPMTQEASGAGGNSGGPAKWLDRHGPMALGVEFVVMLVSGLLAMATDRWFPEKPIRQAARQD
jgi:hypothetical protein